MCVKECQCNTCLKKCSCSDCYYMNWHESVDCHKNGVQNCEHYQYFYNPVEDKKKENE